MIVANAINHLCKTAGSDNVEIAYLFCSYKIQADQSVASLLATLLKQLVQSRLDIAPSITHMYDHYSKQSSRPSLNKIL
jgi:hypothetical protein